MHRAAVADGVGRERSPGSVAALSAVLLAAMTGMPGGTTATHYFNDTVNYTEPLFVVVIMALASTRPVVGFAEAALRRVASARRRDARPPGGSPS